MLRFVHLRENLKWYASFESRMIYNERPDEFKHQDGSSVYYFNSSVTFYSLYSFHTLNCEYQFYGKKRNKYLFITPMWMYIIILFALQWMPTFFYPDCLFFLRLYNNENRLIWWCGAQQRSSRSMIVRSNSKTIQYWSSTCCWC
jgi:hypothetical protein